MYQIHTDTSTNIIDWETLLHVKLNCDSVAFIVNMRVSTLYTILFQYYIIISLLLYSQHIILQGNYNVYLIDKSYIMNKELLSPSNKCDNSYWLPYPYLFSCRPCRWSSVMCHPRFLHCHAAISWRLTSSSQTVTICTDKTLIFAYWFQAVCIQLIQYYSLLKHKQ